MSLSASTLHFSQNQVHALFLNVQPDQIALPMPMPYQAVLGESQGQKKGWGSLYQVSEFDKSSKWQPSI